jgi:hypothetical protein
MNEKEIIEIIKKINKNQKNYKLNFNSDIIFKKYNTIILYDDDIFLLYNNNINNKKIENLLFDLYSNVF